MAESPAQDPRPNGAHSANRHGLPGPYRIVPDKPRVAVTAAGKVRTLRGRGIGAEWVTSKLSRTSFGHLNAAIMIGDRYRSYPVHRLVLEAFVGPRPPGHLCRHLNGVPDDNRVENLAWGTPKENGEDAVRHREMKAERKHPLQRHAPETLAALKELLEVAERNFHQWRRGTTANRQRVAAVVVRARRAVALAEGRDPREAIRDGI
jgi:hypothetical protein